MRGDSEKLLPYVPRLVVEWLRDTPEAAHRRVDGTLAFCDVSGFTALTERLAAGGKAGAEEMGEILNSVFTDLLVGAYDQGAALLKYGGDAVLLLFQGPEHAVRAARSVWTMQSVMARIGSLRTSVGPAQLKMSVGVHSGWIDFFLAGTSHRELIVAGRAATETARLETEAEAGEILISNATASHLSPACLGASRADGILLAGPPGVTPFETFPVGELPDLRVALSAPIVEHVLGGWTGSEHRLSVPGFLQLRGLDDLLDERGPEAVADDLTLIVDRISAACTRHGVTFVSTDISADGAKAIVVAGAPRATPDAEGRTLLALLEVVQQPSLLRVRAGSASGRVFSGDYGPPYRRTYSGIGDAVNLAARIMGKAADGELLAARALLDSSRTAFLWEPVEPFMVKGKSQPVEAVRILAADTSSSSTDGVEHGLPFVGRDAERTSLAQAAAAAAGGEGRAVQVVGGPGAGKSRLVSEAFQGLAGFDRFTLACDAYSSVTPYSVVRRLVMHAIGCGDGRDVEEALGRALEQNVELQPWAPLLGALLGFDVPMTPEVTALNERFRQSKLAELVVALMTATMTESTLLVVDDVHLADEGSRQFLDGLSDVAAERPWLLVLTRRPALELDETGATESDHLWLTPLADDAIRAALLEATQDSSVPEHEIERIVARSAGNPLYARELLSAVEAGESELSDSLEALVAARVDALAPGPRRLLRVAAVCGMTVDPDLLNRVLATAGEHHASSEWAHLNRFVTALPEGWRFREAVVRDAAYEGLPFAARRLLHGQVGDALADAPGERTDDELALLSFHFDRASRWPDALRWSKAAGGRAQARLASLEAARFYDRAIVAARRIRPRPYDALAELTLAAGRAWFAVGENDRAELALAVHPRNSPVDQRLEASMWRARVRLRTGAYTQGLRLLATVERLTFDLPENQQAPLRAEVLAQRAFVRHMQGREREAMRWARKAVALASEAGATAPLAQALQVLDWACVGLGRFDEEPYAERALELWEQVGDLGWQARVLVHLGIRSYYTGHWPAALERYARAQQAFERAGDLWGASVCAGNIAEIYVEQGRLEEALAPTRLALRSARVAGAGSFIALWTAQLGRISLREGRGDEGLALLREAQETYTADGEVGAALVIQAQVAAGLSLTGHHAEALTVARTALEQLGQVPGAAEAEPLLQRVRGFALLGLGLRAEAVSAFRASLSAARSRQARRDIALGLDALISHAGAGAEAMATWGAERDELVAHLGITQLSAKDVELPGLVPLQLGADEVESLEVLVD